MRIGIFGREYENDKNSYLLYLLEILDIHNCEIHVYKPFYDFISTQTTLPEGIQLFETHSDIEGKLDFMLSIGGDGTLLNSVSVIRDSGIPILGINTGRLGFLSHICLDNIEDSILNLISGNFSIEKRSLLQIETENNLFGEFNFGLNDFTIHKKNSNTMITIHAYLNGEFLNSYWADGLIIATPTGSTAYSMSCGGPIIEPSTESFIITPIAPHNLTVRPLVVPDNITITLKPEGRTPQYLANLDSRSETIDCPITFNIKKADFKVKIIRMPNESFLSTIRNKLMWGIDRRN